MQQSKLGTMEPVAAELGTSNRNTVNFELEFVSQFQDRYKRNNKKNGQKNLRCFPNCLEAGHRTHGFCGSPIVIKVTSGNMDPSEWEFWGRIVDLGVYEELHEGTVMARQTLLANSLTKVNLKGVWVQGRIQQTGSSWEILFNESLDGWHYGWVGSKHTCDSFHCFVIHAFQCRVAGSPFLECKLSLESGRFQVYSSRQTYARSNKQKGNSASSEQKQGARKGEGQSVPQPNSQQLFPPSKLFALANAAETFGENKTGNSNPQSNSAGSADPAKQVRESLKKRRVDEDKLSPDWVKVKYDLRTPLLERVYEYVKSQPWYFRNNTTDNKRDASDLLSMYFVIFLAGCVAASPLDVFGKFYEIFVPQRNADGTVQIWTKTTILYDLSDKLIRSTELENALSALLTVNSGPQFVQGGGSMDGGAAFFQNFNSICYKHYVENSTRMGIDTNAVENALRYLCAWNHDTILRGGEAPPPAVFASFALRNLVDGTSENQQQANTPETLRDRFAAGETAFKTPEQKKDWNLTLRSLRERELKCLFLINTVDTRRVAKVFAEARNDMLPAALDLSGHWIKTGTRGDANRVMKSFVAFVMGNDSFMTSMLPFLTKLQGATWELSVRMNRSLFHFSCRNLLFHEVDLLWKLDGKLRVKEGTKPVSVWPLRCYNTFIPSSADLPDYLMKQQIPVVCMVMYGNSRKDNEIREYCVLRLFTISPATGKMNIVCKNFTKASPSASTTQLQYYTPVEDESGFQLAQVHSNAPPLLALLNQGTKVPIQVMSHNGESTEATTLEVSPGCVVDIQGCYSLEYERFQC